MGIWVGVLICVSLIFNEVHRAWPWLSDSSSRTVRNYLGLALLLSSTACVPLGRDERLTEIAREEYTRCGVPDRWLDFSISGQHCIGGPGYSAGAMSVFVPWPWSEWDFAARIIMRYEVSKLAYALNGADRDFSWRWYGPFLAFDATFHGPISEAHSWWHVLVPGDIQYDKIDHGPPVTTAKER